MFWNRKKYDVYYNVVNNGFSFDSWDAEKICSCTTKSEAQAIINYRETDLAIHLFVKKSDDEGKDFYYMGSAKPFNPEETTIKDNKGNDLPIVNFKLKLDCEVKDELYSYFVFD